MIKLIYIGTGTFFPLSFVAVVGAAKMGRSETGATKKGDGLKALLTKFSIVIQI